MMRTATSPRLGVFLLILSSVSSAQDREPYPGEAYIGQHSYRLSVARAPGFREEVNAWLAQPTKDTSPASYKWRTSTYRALVALALDAGSVLPEEWSFDELADALIRPVPLDYEGLPDAILDLVYETTGEDWDLSERRNAEVMNHVESWCHRIDPDSPYWLALHDLRAGLYATLGNKREALDSFDRIDAHIDEERELHRSPIIMNGYAMTRANVWHDIGRDVEALAIADQALAWLDEVPIHTSFGAYMRYFSEERRLQILMALERYGEAQEQVERCLARHQGGVPAEIDVLTEFYTIQAELWLHDWLTRPLDVSERSELAQSIERNIATIDAELATPQALMARTYDTELETRWRFGTPLFEMEWWLHGPEKALRRLHEGQILRFFEEEPSEPDTWFRSQATIMGYWGTLAVEAQAPAEEQARALAQVRQNLPFVVQSLIDLPHFLDGYDPNYRSGLRPLVEAIITHALHGEPGSVTRSEVVDSVIEQGRVGSIAKRMRAQGGTLADVQRELCPPGTGILHFQPGYRNHYWLLIDRNGVLIRPLGPPHEYRALQSQLYSTSQLAQLTARTTQLEKDLHQFSEWVFQDDLLAECRQRGWSTLLTSGIAGHYYVPFDLLPNENGAPLGSEFRIAHLPSLAVGLAIARRDAKRELSTTTRFLSVLAPEIDPTQSSPSHWNPVQNAGARRLAPSDLQSLLSALSRGWFSEVWLGPQQATHSALQQQIGLSWDVLHIFGHGSRAKDRLGTPGVLLHALASRTKLFTHKDLERQSAPWITMLTACSTTDVEPRTGDDGGHHLAGALLAQGGNTVICSALPVEYRESRALDDALLHYLGQGLPAAEALFQARQRLGGAEGPPGLYLVHAFGLGSAAVAPGDPATGRLPEISLSEEDSGRWGFWPYGTASLLSVAGLCLLALCWLGVWLAARRKPSEA